MPRARFAMHRVPEYDESGTLVRARYFGTATAAKAFAKRQMAALGRTAYFMESLPRSTVEELLDEHAPIPDHFR